MLLLDEGVYGLDEYLKDSGWTTEKVKPGTDDGDVVNLARDNGFIVVTMDKQLASRCRVQRIMCVEIGIEAMLPVVVEELNRLVK